MIQHVEIYLNFDWNFFFLTQTCLVTTVDAYVGIESIKEFGEIFGAGRQRFAFDTNPLISFWTSEIKI